LHYVAKPPRLYFNHHFFFITPPCPHFFRGNLCKLFVNTFKRSCLRRRESTAYRFTGTWRFYPLIPNIIRRLLWSIPVSPTISVC
jgi:hypothetical protein